MIQEADNDDCLFNFVAGYRALRLPEALAITGTRLRIRRSPGNQ